MEQGTGPVITLGKFPATCGPDSLGRGEGLTFGQYGSSACEMETATFGLQGAVALGRIGFKLRIDGAYFSHSLLGDTTGIRGLDGITTTHGREGKSMNSE